MSTSTPHTLKSIQDIRHHFANATKPYYFISATDFNLMGMHEWVKNWLNVNLIDCYSGRHPHVLLIEDDHAQVFQGIEDINQYLLQSPAFQTAHQPNGHAIFLFFDEAIEAQCQALGLNVLLPPHALVKEVDSKIVTTEIGNQADVQSVPHTLAKVASYEDLIALAKAHNLGDRLVVQTPYGDSGKTTFFIDCEDDYRPVAHQIEGEDRVKVMRRVNCRGTAIEACATRWGTFVGPLMTELIGDTQLTPYPGGWCGNELYDGAFSSQIRQQVLRKTQALGDALYKRGYRGYFEVDYLIDQDTQAVYLGELNARITGITAMTNLSSFSSKHLPLFLFHLLEYDDQVQLELDASAFNQLTLLEGAWGTASQLILKHTDAQLKRITQAPESGVYTLRPDGSLSLKHPGHRRGDAQADDEAYILRILNTHDYAYEGADLAIMFVNQAIGTDQGKLNDNGSRWAAALKQCFEYRPLNHIERAAVERAHFPAEVKSSRDTR